MNARRARPAPPADAPVGIGLCGLGRALTLTLPSLLADPRVRLVAACEPQPAPRQALAARFPRARVAATLDALCADPAVELVYLASPHELHAPQALQALAAGKHLLVEKPLAVRLDDAERVVAAAAAAGRHLLVGPSHGDDPPVRLAARLLAAGRVGRPRLIQAFNYTDFMVRPRRPEELVSARGGGVVFSQGAHQIDIVRRLAAPARASDVSAGVGDWDPARPGDGAYNALLRFDDGLSASLVYSGYAHFDSDQWMDWSGELGRPKDPAGYGHARRALAALGHGGAGGAAEVAAKRRRGFHQASAGAPAVAPAHEHFGPVLVVGERGDLRLSAHGVWVYDHRGRAFVPAPAGRAGRAGVVDALHAALRAGVAPTLDGRWGLATLEICHAIRRSSASGRPVALTRQ